MLARPHLLIAFIALVSAAAHFSPRLCGSENEVSLHAEELGLARATTETLQTAIAAADWRAAESILFEAAGSNPASASLLRALGIAHYQAGRYFSASSALKRSDALDPLDPEARFLLAGSFIRIERRHWARAELEKLAATHGESGRYRLALARVHYDQGQFAAALSQLIRIRDGSLTSAEAHDLRGQSLEGLGRNEAAIAAYKEAISLNREAVPASAWPHYHLGSLLHDLGGLEAAEAALAAAVTLDQTHAPAQRELGVVYLKANKLRLAAEALESAAKLSPLDPAVQYSLVSVYRRLDREGLAKAAMERFRELTE
ncbi:MAG: tetratricopeptide repeat protein [Bryobacterales bacterium]|nr:tetratricopeptide repeat protein [Bryobacterales bacterium]MDE0262226.1 tetratricopeptide repeat protein [Bryobacterales bacterium]MDE0620215.1 tetratricopeptide repeat protein [Bryobacterales bacterium]